MNIDPGSAIWKDLKREIASQINIEEFYRKHLKDFAGIGEISPCPFCREKNVTASLRVFETGAFQCFSKGCQFEGESIVDFWAVKKDISDRFEASRSLYNAEIQPEVSEDIVNSLPIRLLEQPEILEKIRFATGIQDDIIRIFNLGWDSPESILFPVRNYLNFVVALASVPLDNSRCVVQEGQPGTHLWPLHGVGNHKSLVVCGTYLEAACALSHGVAAVGLPRPDAIPPFMDLDILRGKELYITFDNSRTFANILLSRQISSKIKLIQLPEKGNLIDYLYIKNHTADDLGDFARGHSWLKIPSVHLSSKNPKVLGGPPLISLEESIEDKWFERIFQVEASVIAMDAGTIKFPHRLRVSCSSKNKKCENCPLMKELGIDFEFSITDCELPKYADYNELDMTRAIKQRLHIAPRCSISCVVTHTYTGTAVLVSSPLTYYNYSYSENGHSHGTTVADGQSTASSIINEVGSRQIWAYYFSTSVTPNKTYRFKGYSTRDKSNRTLLIFLEGEPVASGIDSFELTKEVKDTLGSVFKVPAGMKIMDWLLESFYVHMAETVTGIRGRPLTHMAEDLIWTCPISFSFAGQWERRASLDVMVWGDTACAKTHIAKRLLQHYEFGDMASGENITGMNLIGGMRNYASYQGICWGIIAQMHRGVLIVDEMSAIPTDILGRLTSLRSEGVAQVDKQGYKGRANALTAVLWLSNTRTGVDINSYDYGVESLMDLMVRNEDVRRLDYAHAVSKLDISRDTFADPPGTIYGECRYSPRDCHDLILWIKSRQANQIHFTDSAIQAAFTHADSLARIYHDSIPLFPAAVGRIKIAKIAAAIAGRIYSTDPSGTILWIDEACVDAAAEFLDLLYKHPAMGYRAYSRDKYSMEDLNVALLEQRWALVCSQANIDPRSLCTLFLGTPEITRQGIIDWVGGDQYHAQPFITGLLHLHAMTQLTKYKNGYKKQEGFVKWLRAKVGMTESTEKAPF